MIAAGELGMLWKMWKAWTGTSPGTRRINASRKFGLGYGIECLEIRTLLSTINGVNVASRFTLNADKASKTNVSFTLTGLAQDSNGDGNVNGRNVTFTGQMTKISANNRITVEVLNSSGTVLDSSALTPSGSIATFTLSVTLANTSSAQVLTFRVLGGSPIHNTTRRVANVNKTAGGALTSTLTIKPVAPGTPNLNSSSDTGPSSSDNKTKDPTPTFSVSGIVVGNTVELLRNGTVVGTVNGATSSTVNITSSSTTSGTYTYTARQSATSGGITGTVSGSLSVTIDTSAPGILAAPDLKATSDTGTLNSDNITRNTSLSFDIGNVEAGALVELLRGGIVVASQGNAAAGTITISVAGTPSGSSTFTARQTDVAGNVSAISGSLSVAVDSSAPASPLVPNLQDASDTGSSNSDNITSDTSPSFDIGGIEPGAFVELLRGGTVVATLSIAGGSTVTLTDPAAPAGTFNYTARQTDFAGNIGSVSQPLSITVNLAAPGVPDTPDLQAASDTGLSDTDDITSASELNFDVSGIFAGSSVEFLRNGVVIATSNSPAGGTVTFSDRNVPEGISFYTARQTDTAGTVSDESGALQVTFDSGIPAAENTLDLQPASDLGISNSDNLTNDTTPSFNIENVEAGALVELLREGTVVASLTSVAAGTVTLTDPAAPSGMLSYSARQTDAAGNTGPLGGALNVTIETVAPDAPSTPDLLSASDAGLSDSDEITNVTVPSFNIANVEVGATVELLREGTVVATLNNANSGNIVLTDPAAPAGVSQYTARQTDAAGNVSSTSLPLQVTIDTSVPSVPGIPDLTAASDSGIDDGDGITKITALMFDIDGIAAGASVDLLRDGVVVATVDGAAEGTVTLTDPAASSGTSLYTARQRTIAGTNSLDSAELSLTVDTTEPAIPGAPDLQAASDLGVSNADDITSTTAPAFNIGNVEAGATVELLRGGSVVASLDNAAEGTVSLVDPSPPDGTHAYTTRQRDAAGNVSESSTPLSVIVSTAVPPTPNIPDLQTDSDLGSSNNDNITSTASLVFDISGIIAGNSVDLLREGVVVNTLDDAGAGTISLADPSGQLGTAVYAARQRSIAGTNSADSSTLSVTVDATPPASPDAPDLKATSDTGISNTDNITQDPSPSFSIGNVEEGAMVQLLRGGVVVATQNRAAGGTISLTDPLAPFDTHQYTVRQIDAAGNAGAVSTALSVTVQPNPSNHVPTAVVDTYSTNKNVPLIVGGMGVLANDTDLDAHPLTALLGGPGTGGGGGGGGGGAIPTHGVLVLNPNGSFSYSPDEDFVGTDTFRYRANDVFSDSNVVMVTIVIRDATTDDHGNTSATATFLNIPATIGGNLEIADDVDCFQFNAVAGTIYSLEVSLGSGPEDLPDSTLMLIDSNGSTVLRTDDNSGEGLGSLIKYRATKNGPLFLKVSGTGSNTGTYTLHAEVNTSLPPELTLGGPPVTWINKQAPVTVLPQITVGDAAFLEGGTLTISVNAIGTAKKLFDQFQFPSSSGLGSSSGQQFANGRVTLQIQLSENATSGAIQTFLRGIKFATKGKGLKALTRTFTVTLADAGGLSANVSQTINVRKKA